MSACTVAKKRPIRGDAILATYRPPEPETQRRSKDRAALAAEIAARTLAERRVRRAQRTRAEKLIESQLLITVITTIHSLSQLFIDFGPHCPLQLNRGILSIVNGRNRQHLSAATSFDVLRTPRCVFLLSLRSLFISLLGFGHATHTYSELRESAREMSGAAAAAAAAVAENVHRHAADSSCVSNAISCAPMRIGAPQTMNEPKIKECSLRRASVCVCAQRERDGRSGKKQPTHAHTPNRQARRRQFAAASGPINLQQYDLFLFFLVRWPFLHSGCSRLPAARRSASRSVPMPRERGRNGNARCSVRIVCRWASVARLHQPRTIFEFSSRGVVW